MVDLTILSIFRDSTAYLDRYLSQVREVLPHFGTVRLCWLEGDSVDGTYEALHFAGGELDAEVWLISHDTGGRYWPSISHPDRWRQLAECWNANLDNLKPSRLAVCVESDLIWEWPQLEATIGLLREADADVAYPLLMCGRAPALCYDVHGFRAGGQAFTAGAPYAPTYDGERIVSVEQGGGMIVTTGAMLARARWGESDCVLHFPSEARQVVDLETRILHP